MLAVFTTSGRLAQVTSRGSGSVLDAVIKTSVTSHFCKRGTFAAEHTSRSNVQTLWETHNAHLISAYISQTVPLHYKDTYLLALYWYQTSSQETKFWTPQKYPAGRISDPDQGTFKQVALRNLIQYRYTIPTKLSHSKHSIPRLDVGKIWRGSDTFPVNIMTMRQHIPSCWQPDSLLLRFDDIKTPKLH